MATINDTNPTLLDLKSRLDPDDSIADIIELLAATNEVLDDMSWIEGNLATGHVTTVRGGLPTATWRLLNYGVPADKSQTRQVTDTCGMLEAYAEVDKKLVQLAKDPQMFRKSEDIAFLEAMNQQMASALIYGNQATDPERITGLAPRYNSLSAENAANIVSGGGSGSDNTSIWLVVWGPNTVHGIYPRGSRAGLEMEDLGEETLLDALGGRYQGYRTHYSWHAGLTLRDWRYVVRIPNIDYSDLVAGNSNAADLVDLMISASEIPPNLSMGRPVFYMNRYVRTLLRKQMKDGTNVNLSLDEVAGRKVMSFDGIPIRRCDAILNTEAAVS